MKITPQEFKEKMEKIRSDMGGDPEIAHGEMDDLIAQTLSDLGYEDGIAIFNEQTKWYS